MEKFLTVDEVARILRVSYRTMRQLVCEGQISHVKVGRQIRIPQSALDSYLRKDLSD